MKDKIALIGVGKLGASLSSSFKTQNFDFQVWDKDNSSRKKNTNLPFAQNLEELIQSCRLIILCVKPAQFLSLAEEISPILNEDHSVLSVMAGVNSDQIKSALKTKKVLRVMPNVGALQQLSLTAIMKDANQASLQDRAVQIFNGIGKTYLIEEKSFDLFTAVGASGPAFVFEAMRSISNVCQRLGFPEELAKDLTIELLQSSAQLWQNSDDSLHEWIARVATPGGCTEHGLKTLEAGKFSETITDCIQKTREKSRELSLLVQQESD